VTKGFNVTHNDNWHCAAIRRATVLAAIAILLCGGQSCGTSAAAEPSAVASARSSVLDATLGDGDPSPEISTAEFQAALRDPTVVVLDARPPAEYAVSHVPGAQNVPGKPNLPASAYTADIAAVLKLIPDRKRRLVLYCNGLHCGRSKRFAAELRGGGYADVRRYQLGIPAWRALGGVTQVEKDALLSLLARDATAVLIDAREAGARPRIANARAIPLRDAAKAKDDGRLPMTDHNTRIFVVGDNGTQARAVAEAIVHDAFHNVSFFGGTSTDLPELATTVPR
jgi:rhodanese-related sulfurtransferase